MTTKGEYALLWANGKSFSEIYDLMEAEIKLKTQVDTLEWRGSLDNWDGTAERITVRLDNRIAALRAAIDGLDDEDIDDWGDGATEPGDPV